jgi:hypothetical protein
MKILTKSKYLLFLQCPKLLWINFNEKDLIPETDEATQHIFDQGTLIGELAVKLFPEGIFIKSDDFIENLEKTKELLKKRKPLFEAGFRAENIFSRADILNPVNTDEWDIIEVKSSTEVKDINIQDVSFQKYCYEKCGLKIRKCFLMFINNKYVRKGDLEPEKLFKKQEITEEVDEAIKGINERINEAFSIISQPAMPKISIGKYCKKPYACALFDECWGFLPKNSVFDLYNCRKCFKLFEKGILRIKDIPDDFKLSGNQKIQHNCEKTGKPFINKNGIKSFLKTLSYPLYFMDFETYNTVIPLYDDLKPYQQVPFQFSLHIQEDSESELKHFSFLAEGTDDPRPKFMYELKRLLGTKGSIIVYNQAFERMILKQTAEFLKDFKDWVCDVNSRIIDLLTPFKNFFYYNPEQQGSASIKKVLPAITGKNYEGMEIAQGGDASRKYFQITHGYFDGKMPSEEEIKKFREALEKYCEMDTLAEVMILEKLRKIIQ